MLRRLDARSCGRRKHLASNGRVVSGLRNGKNIITILAWLESGSSGMRRKTSLTSESTASVFKKPVRCSGIPCTLQSQIVSWTGSNAGRHWEWREGQREPSCFCWLRTQPARNWNLELSSRWFASSPLEKLPRRSEKAMKTKMVSYTQETMPELTKAQIANLDALAARPDSEIDTSDIPELIRGEVEAGNTWPFLSPSEAADNGACGCRCAGMAEGARQRLSVAHQCNSAAGDAGSASRDGCEVG